MKRKSKIPEGTLPLWLNKAGSYRTPDGTKVGPGDYFRAEEKDVPQMFRDTIIRVDAEEKKANPELISEIPDKYHLQKRSTAWYDVVDEDGTLMNQQAMRKIEAEAFAKELNSK